MIIFKGSPYCRIVLWALLLDDSMAATRTPPLLDHINTLGMDPDDNILKAKQTPSECEKELTVEDENADLKGAPLSDNDLTLICCRH